MTLTKTIAHLEVSNNEEGWMDAYFLCSSAHNGSCRIDDCSGIDDCFCDERVLRVTIVRFTDSTMSGKTQFQK